MDGMNNTYNVIYVSEHVYVSLIILHVVKDINKEYSMETDSGHNQLKSHKINSNKTGQTWLSMKIIDSHHKIKSIST